MRYAKFIDPVSGQLAAGTGGAGGVEISETEYNALVSEIREKAMLTNRLYSGEIALDAVPAEWQEEIQRRVNERREREAEAEAAAEATEADYLAALAELGVSVDAKN